MRPSKTKEPVRGVKKRNNDRRRVLWKARNVALGRLRKKHEDEYQRLYAEAVLELAPDKPVDRMYAYRTSQK